MSKTDNNYPTPPAGVTNTKSPRDIRVSAPEAKKVFPENADDADDVIPTARDPNKVKAPALTSAISKASAAESRRQIGGSTIELVKRRRNGEVFAVIDDGSNRRSIPIKSPEFENFVRMEYAKTGEYLKTFELQDVIQQMEAQGWIGGPVVDIYYRVGPYKDGIEIDCCDENNTRIRVIPGQVKIIRSGSDTLFYRTPICLPLALPAESGDISLLKKYLNMHPYFQILFRAWLSYTLAHPKVASSKFLILVLNGDAGTGKSFLVNNVLLPLIDPTTIGAQVFPSSEKDLAIALQNTHVLAYDNMRGFRSAMSDFLCVACTGGTIGARELYTNSGFNVQSVHGAIVFNGIHDFIKHPDLAERCLPLTMNLIPKSNRKSEAALAEEFTRDQPLIFRGLLDLISKILVHIKDVEVVDPERMFDFSEWLAAMEIAEDVPKGAYQQMYSDVLKTAQTESLYEHILASSVIEFLESYHNPFWSGTPAALLAELNNHTSLDIQRSREWPKTPSSLSRHLNALKKSFAGQGIVIEFTRGKQRRITITNHGDA